MKMCDIPCAVNTAFHQASFPANTEVSFQVLEFNLSAGIFFNEDLMDG